MKYQTYRQIVFDTVMSAVDVGLIYLSAGNFSMRIDPKTIAITPGSIPYDKMQPEDIAIVNVDGDSIDAPKRLSSETPMHTYIYRHMPKVNGICHTHSPYAITFAMLGKPVPIVNLELLVCGAPIPVASWATPGTNNAGKAVVELLGNQPVLSVVLLRNHGLVSIGSSLDKAYTFAFDAESGMKTYHQSLQIGQPNVIADKQIEDIKRVYGSFEDINQVIEL